MISEETINVWFAFCVWILNGMAEMLGISYNAINIWIFVILGPILFFTLVFMLIRQLILTGKYRNLYNKSLKELVTLKRSAF